MNCSYLKSSILSILIFTFVGANASGNDNKNKTDNKSDAGNIMLNAESANKPREINIGLNSEDYGTLIVEDGLLSSFIDYPLYSHFHWAGGNSYMSPTLFSLEETALSYAHMGFAVDSRTVLGGDNLAGAVTLATSSDLLMKLDANINGTFGKGLYFTVGAYVNKNPTSTHPSFQRYVNDLHVFKTGLTYKWGTSEVSLLYKLSLSKGLPSNAFSAPFYYNGDGSITAFEGFKLGRDNYLPSDDSFQYMDVVTGEMKNRQLRDIGQKRFHDIVLKYDTRLDNDWKLEAGAHVLYAGKYENASYFTAGIDKKTDGKLIQNRNLSLYNCNYLDVMGDIKVKRTIGRHELIFGANEMFLKHRFLQSSASFAHTVEVNPSRVARDEEMTWGYNTSAKYYDGVSTATALYAKDIWTIHPKVTLNYGVRATYQYFDVEAAVNEEGETVNNRTAGFNLQNALLRRYKRSNLTACALAKLDWNIYDKLFFSVEEIFVQNPRQMCHFSSATMPSDKLVNTSLTRGGFSWNNEWVDVALMASYIRKDNLNSGGNASKQVGGNTETASYLALYSMGTAGVTADATFHHKFDSHDVSFHALCTYQEPKYASYTADAVFSDGVEHLDFSGKYIPNTSRVLLEFDPSYGYKGMKVWLSARYYSKQFANKVNNVYFNGHWETFGGISYLLKEKYNFGINLTNLLGQTGAKGSIAAADTLTDTSLLNGYLLAGSYIIPFTATATITIRL